MAIKIQGSTIIDDSRKVINASHVGIGTTNPTVELDVDGQANISGIVTASKYVVQGGSSTGFLKADGSIDSSPYATGTGTLDSIVIKDNSQNVGSASTFTSIDFYNGIGVSTTGVVGVASVRLEDNISISGIFTAASFSGSGSGLTSIPTSALVGLATDADKLDGQEGTYYLNYSNFSGIATDSDKLDGQDGTYYLNYSNFSGIATDSDKLDGQDGTYYLNYSNFSGIATDSDKLDGQEGTYYLNYSNFSGIATDSDKLDGIDSTSFLRSDDTDIKTSGNLTFNDNIKLHFGSSNQDDASLYHDATDTRIENRTGDLILETIDTGEGGAGADIVIKAGTGKTSVLANVNGAVELWNNGSKKFETVGTGVSISSGTASTATIYGPGNLIIDPAPINNNGGIVRIKGDLYIDGTTTEINSTTLTIDDLNVVVASGATNGLTADGAGLSVAGAGATIKYNYNGGSEQWVFNKAPYYNTNRLLTTADEGTGNGLDADTLDGQEGSYYLNYSNFSGIATDSDKLDGQDGTYYLNYSNFSGIATDSDKLDGIDSGSFLRSDAADVKTSGNLQFDPNVKLELGNAKGELYYDNTDVLFYSGTPDIRIGSKSGHTVFGYSTGAGTSIARFNNAGSVELNYANNKKFQTRTDGIAVSGIVTAISGVVTYYGDGSQLTGIAVSPGGSDGQIQYNNGGSFGGASQLYYDDANNRVGIGSSAPTETLDVQGTVHISKAAGTFSPHLELFAENSEGGILIAKHASSYPNLTFRGEAGGGSSDYFSGVINEQLSNGIYKTGLKLNDNKALIFGTGGDAFVEYDPTPGVLEIKTVVAEPITVHTNDTERLRIISDGNIGIGSTQPTAKLDVNGTLNVSGISTFENNVHLLNNDHLYFGTNDDIDIYSNGSTGIVTSTVNLHVRTPHLNLMDNASHNIAVFDDSNGVFLFHNNSKKFETTGYGVTVIGGLNVSGIVTATSFSGDGSNLTGIATIGSRWITTGYTGIGTTSAVGIGTIIEVIPYDTQNNGTLSFEGSAGQLFSITNDLTTGSIFSVNDVSGIPSIDVDADGTIQLAPFGATEFVGIGITNPTAKLHVNGTVALGSSVYDANGTFGTNGQVLSNVTGFGVSWTNASAGGGSVAGSDGQIQYNNNGSFGGAAQLYYDDTNNRLGINSSTPTSTLDVNGTLNVSGISTFQNNVHLLSNDHLYFGSNNDIDIYSDGSTGRLITSDNFYVRAPQLGVLNNAGSQNIAIFDDTDGVSLYHNGNKKLETTSGGVNVTGILTATSEVFVGSGADTVTLKSGSVFYNNYTSSKFRGNTLQITVKVISKSTHRYSGGSSSAYEIDGVEAPFLTFVPGMTYRFNQNDSSNATHPLRFYLDADKTTEYTEGVITSGTPGSSGYTEITINEYTPSVLYYQCSAHDYMGNAIQTHGSTIVDGRHDTAPNATVPVHSLSGIGTETNIDVALIPKGTGAVLASVPDGASTGGNKRGENAVDLQTVRGSATKVASGYRSAILGGYNNEASGELSGVINGQQNTSSGFAAISGGSDSTSSGDYSVALGYVPTANSHYSCVLGGSFGNSRGIVGNFVTASHGSSGIGQKAHLIVSAQTTNANQTNLTTNGAVTVSASNQVTLPNNAAYAFKGTCVAGVTGAGNTKAWEFRGVIKRGANAASTTLVGSVIKDVLAYDAGAAAWDVEFVADTTNGALQVRVTGQVSTTIRWVCSIETTEMTF